MGYRTSYIRTVHVSSGNSLSSFSRFGRRVLYHRDGYAVKRYHKFSPNIPPKRRGENIFGVLAPRMTNFLMSHHYINTSVQKTRILGFPGCLEQSQTIWNSILSAKRDKTELHVISLDLAFAYGSVLHHLIRMALDFFNLPSKVGEIIMKYFNSAFMKFTVKDYATKWLALQIGIMMGCIIFSLLFVLAMELILRGLANTSKGVMKNEHLTLPSSRAFMNEITILVLSESRFIYQFWKPTAPNIFTGRRIQNWESTPSYDNEGLSRQDHSEGVSRNEIRYEVVGH